MPPVIERPWDLPRLRVSFGLEFDTKYLRVDDKVAEFFDVKFCPFQPLDKDPIFAAISKKHVVICRLSSSSSDDANPCEIVKVIRDEDLDAVDYCCTWSRDIETGRPILAIAGQDAKIKVFDIIDSWLVTCLVGHGGDINDLITSPINPQIIASASDDTTVRIWSLDPIHAKQPCLCLLGGEGHSWNLLSVAFHDCGRYLLSAGHDQVINLWTIPDLATEPIRSPIEIHFPHFSTSEIHSGIVDCLAFYGDNILSRACHDDMIIMWRIEGFSSDDPPPAPEDAPTTYNPSRLTRSAFSPTYTPGSPRQFTRLMAFHTPGCGPQFFMRFRLFFVPGEHAVLAFCNAAGKIFFWDLERLVCYHEYKRLLAKSDGKDEKLRPSRPTWLATIMKRGAEGGAAGDAAGKSKAIANASDKDSDGSDQDAAGPSAKAGEAAGQKVGVFAAYNAETIASWEGKYSASNPHEPLKAHGVETVGTSNFVGRQVAWSPGGEWCVVVGSSNCALVLQRWKEDRETAAAAAAAAAADPDNAGAAARP